jgi:hypothetical protein
MKFANERKGWAVHIHLVLDAHPALLDKAAITRDWYEVTSGRGGAIWDSSGATRATTEQLAAYMTKPDCWSWQRLHGTPLEVFVHAAHGRHHVISWGSGRRKRRGGRG